MKKKSQTQKTLSLLLSGKIPEAKKYAGKHVMVVKNKIVPLRKGKARADFKKLKKKHKETPIIVFVPRPDISYILITWK